MSQKQQEGGLEQQVKSEGSAMEEAQTEPVTPVSVTSTSPSMPIAEEDVAVADVQETQTSEERQPTVAAPQEKRHKRKTKWVSAEEVSPKPSYWPFALTVSVCVLLIGVMTHPIVIGVGALLVIICIMGWMLERR